jgi:hypothetical protein
MTYGLRSPRILFLERFAKNRGKLPIIRARTRESSQAQSLRGSDDLKFSSL